MWKMNLLITINYFSSLKIRKVGCHWGNWFGLSPHTGNQSVATIAFRSTNWEIANKLNKPLIIHSRSARQDTMDMLEQNNAENAVGVALLYRRLHAKRALDIGFYISISGHYYFLPQCRRTPEKSCEKCR